MNIKLRANEYFNKFLCWFLKLANDVVFSSTNFIEKTKSYL